jgi:hypothetical protein
LTKTGVSVEEIRQSPKVVTCTPEVSKRVAQHVEMGTFAVEAIKPKDGYIAFAGTRRKGKTRANGEGFSGWRQYDFFLDGDRPVRSRSPTDMSTSRF